MILFASSKATPGLVIVTDLRAEVTRWVGSFMKCLVDILGPGVSCGGGLGSAPVRLGWVLRGKKNGKNEKLPWEFGYRLSRGWREIANVGR